MNRFSDTPREEILKAAKKIASEQGLNNVSIREVAKACGISIGTIYNSYRSKDELILGIIGDFWHQAFSKAFPSNNPQSFYDNFSSLYLQLAQYLNQSEADWMSQLSYLSEKAKQQGVIHMSQCFKQITDDIAVWLQNDPTLSQANQDSPPITTERLANFIFRTMLDELRSGSRDPEFLLCILHRIL